MACDIRAEPSHELLVDHLTNLVEVTDRRQPEGDRLRFGLVFVGVGLEVQADGIQVEERCGQVLDQGLLASQDGKPGIPRRLDSS
jgi:hypothetical protein